MHQEPWRALVAGPSRAVLSPTADGRPALMPFFHGGIHASRRHDYNAPMPLTNFEHSSSLTNCSLTNLPKLESSCCCIDKVGQPGRHGNPPACLGKIDSSGMICGMVAGRADYGASILSSCAPPSADIADPQYNKSLHPIRPLVPAFACCSFGAANAGPMVRTGELNR